MLRNVSSGRGVHCVMDAQEQARHQLELAEAELTVIKQELVLQHLFDTSAPTEEASRQLRRLREIAAALALRPPALSMQTDEAA